MKTYRLSLLLLVAFVATLFTFSDAQAQRRGRGRGYTKNDVNRVIQRVENRSDDFVSVLDRALDDSRLDGSRREDTLNKLAQQMETQLDVVRSDFDRRNAYYETRPEIARVLSIANNINNTMQRRRLGRQAERSWAALRADLNTLANVYNLPRVN